ncbi:1-aminocyclopropane-1-carboxylate deaminase [Actinomycetospora sp. NBRC 106375]|uniref:1-aminocyclopropane-1-carboxylate deaminase/D-cysteine desulfhydrase n=1 Tax=Actinomycetospora sp. NBRC 106375 TaxID=3032207 RepID=UPI0024A340A5|nr:pyridoxal-phosphate dependent enzyme [Actinomycetospora sp. NBRC 106375]GLZ48242.1 1-aminocyclopropane-1-carboxylate deaminase [Actinomycetospora sp. NBRC 106375]
MTGLLGQPRVHLATLPTPLQPAPRLSAEAGVEIWLKRDDLTGLGLGGNKVRGLEFLVADALARRCDHLVTGGGPGSNWAMLAALAARVHGLGATLVCYGDRVPAVGNTALAALVGTTVRFTGDPDRTSVDTGVETVAQELRVLGRHPYVLGRGGATPVGALGYVHASVELAGQLAAVGVGPRGIWLATGSCGTQAGLHAGAHWQGLGPVTGVTVSRPVAECVERVTALSAKAAERIGVPPPATPPTVLGGHLGPGYGHRSAEGEAAAALVARTEGVFLDPVFAAKAMAGLLAAAARGDVTGPLVFLVSGGAPTLFTTPPLVS